jgi:large subunit ribosomal protein L22
MKTIARLRYFGVGTLKVRRFAGTIKGQPVRSALAILEVQGSPTCQTLHKLLTSAVANAEHNNQLSADNLEVSNVLVDDAPRMKRIRPRARGRAYRIEKRACHVTIEVDLRKDLRQAQSSAAKGAAAKVKKEAAPAAESGTAAKKPATRKAAEGKTSSRSKKGSES